MYPIVTSILLGLTAAAANAFGGAIIVKRHWERRYLRYFIALGAGFMLATSLVEMIPESLELRGKAAALLVLTGYLIIHFFEFTPTSRTLFYLDSSSTPFSTGSPSHPDSWSPIGWAG